MNPGWWIAGGGAALAALALHPFVTYPLSLALLARLRPQAPSAAAVPLHAPAQARVALLVCAYNEAPVIAAKAANMLRLRAAVPGLEILAWVDAASDDTARILRGFEGIQVFEAERRRGKTHGMNRLVAATRADILVCTDANVMFADDALPRLLAPFADPGVGLVCGHLVYADDPGTAMGGTGNLFWRIEERIKALEDATGGGVTADGSIFAFRRALHRPPPDDLIDDMHLSLSILLEGHRIARAADAIATEPPVTGIREEFRRKRRIACQAYNVHRALAPRLRRLPALPRYKYLSHKWLRWWSGWLLAAAAVLVPAGLALAGHGALAVSLVALGLAVGLMGWAWPSGPAGKLVAAAAAFAATGLGLVESLAGRRYQTWAPPASARATEP